jgi:surface antigen
MLSAVAVLTLLMSPVNLVDPTAKNWSSSPVFLARYERENSKAVSTAVFVSEPHLPVIPDRPNYRPRIGARIGKKTTAPARARVLRVVSGKRTKTGQCVAWARSQGFEIYGNANKWPTLARKENYLVDLEPTVGAIIVTSESSAGTNTGHVTGAIKVIDGNWAYISEQNYRRGMVTEGWIDLTSPLIVAFIHPKFDRS